MLEREGKRVVVQASGGKLCLQTTKIIRTKPVCCWKYRKACAKRT